MTRKITQTAVFIALLVVFQAVTASLGNTLVTGSVVNMLLILSVMICGIKSACVVGLVSPVLAKLIGIGPLWSLIPFILLGNLTIIFLWHLIGDQTLLRKVLALVLGAVCKFAVLYLGVVQVAVPLILKLSGPQATVISGMFSIPQLITALVGGAAALILLPFIRRAINKA